MMIALKARTRVAAIFAVSLLASAAAAQQTSTIRGTVTSSEDRAPIAGARVAIQAPDRVAITDERGMYVLRDVPQGSRLLLVTAIGRKPDSSRVSVASGSATADFALKEGSLMLSSVMVSATRTPLEAQKVAAIDDVEFAIGVGGGVRRAWRPVQHGDLAKNLTGPDQIENSVPAVRRRGGYFHRPRHHGKQAVAGISLGRDRHPALHGGMFCVAAKLIERFGLQIRKDRVPAQDR